LAPDALPGVESLAGPEGLTCTIRLGPRMAAVVTQEKPPYRFGGYTLGREIGHGAYATVFTCQKAATGEFFAVKVINLSKLIISPNMRREMKKLQREAKILKSLPAHPNLVRFVDVLEVDSHWLFFVLELVEGGDLFQIFRKVSRSVGKRPRLQEAEALYVFRQLVEGLALLHSKGVIHRDLKLENVLVARKHEGPPLLLDVKIADFGLSKVVGAEFSEARSTVGSPRYMAPEVKASEGSHDHRADLWSLGILLCVLLQGRFPNDAPAQVSQATLNAAVARLPVSAEAQAVVSGLLRRDPEKRLTIDDLRQHPWLLSPDPVVPSKRRRIWKKGGDSAFAEDSLWAPSDDQAVDSAVAEVAEATATVPDDAVSLGRSGGRGGTAAASSALGAKPLGSGKVYRGAGRGRATARRGRGGSSRGRAAGPRRSSQVRNSAVRGRRLLRKSSGSRGLGRAAAGSTKSG